MSRKLRNLAVVSSAASSVLIFGFQAFGAVTYRSLPDTGTGMAPTAWPGAAANGTVPVSNVGTDPILVSGNSGNLGSPNTGTVPETVGPLKIEGETFTPLSTFKLGAISIVASGSPFTGSDLSLHIFQLSTQAYPVFPTTGGYVLSTAEVGNDLLGAGSGVSLQYNGNGNAEVTEFDFTGSDQVTLQAGVPYALEFWNADASGTIFMQRLSTQVADGPGLIGTGGETLANASGNDDAQEPSSPELRGRVGGGPRTLLSAFYPAPSIVGSLTSQWINNGSTPASMGWSQAGNWSATIPTLPSDRAVFGAALTTPGSSLWMDGNRSLGQITFNNTISYVIDPSNPANQTPNSILTIDDTGDTGGVNPLINVLLGSHTITAPVNLAAGVTISTAAGSSLTFTNTDTQTNPGTPGTGNITGTGPLSITGSGSVTIAGVANTYTGATNVGSGATLNVVSSLPATTALTANGTVNFSASTATGISPQTVASITLATGGKVAVAAPSATANRTVLVTSALNFGGSTGAWQGLLDLTKNDMIVHGGAVATIENQLKQGLAGTAGIESSSVAGSSPKTALGYGTMTGTFDGQAVTASDVVIKYTLSGDATLDGSVNFSDLLIVAQHYNGTSTLWQTGDFNYDGTTNFSDLLSLAQNYNKNLALTASQVSSLDAAGGASFSAAFAQAEAQAAVPEPTTLSLLGVGVMGLLARRRRMIKVH